MKSPGYPNVKPRQSNTESLYDKRKELIENKHDPMFGDVLHSRFEARIGKIPFYKLYKQNNRCERVSIEALDVKDFWKIDHTHRLFVRCALDRTLDYALSLIPEAFRKPFETSYQVVMKKIWDPKKIWNYLPGVLDRSGIFPPK